MAKRTEFSTDIVCNDEFLKMSHNAQLLYFYLGLYTDENGFVNNPKSIARLNMLMDQALDELISKGYVAPVKNSIKVII